MCAGWPKGPRAPWLCGHLRRKAMTSLSGRVAPNRRGRFSGVGCRHRTFEGSLSMCFARRSRLPVSAMRRTDRIVSVWGVTVR